MSYVRSFLTFLPQKLLKQLVLKAIEVYVRCGCAHVVFRSTISSFHPQLTDYASFSRRKKMTMTMTRIFLVVRRDHVADDAHIHVDYFVDNHVCSHMAFHRGCV
jgi:hypothetical protein